MTSSALDIHHLGALDDPMAIPPGETTIHPTSTGDKPDIGKMEEKPGSLGTHNAKVFHSPSGMNWLVKSAPQQFLPEVDASTAKLQAYSGLPTPPTFKVPYKNSVASAQLMFKGAKDAFPNGFDPESLSDDDLLTVQKHHALDWLIGNHDAHQGQFIRTPDGKLIGIDKGQAFKHYNDDQLHWRYHPNKVYGEKEPIYNTLYRNYANGGRQILDPRKGELGDFVQHLQDIPDDEYKKLLTYYAHLAADSNSLGLKYSPTDTAFRFTPNNPDEFLNYAVQRKNNLKEDLGKLFDKAKANRMLGRKISAIIFTGDDSPTKDGFVHFSFNSDSALFDIEATIEKYASDPKYDDMTPVDEQPSDLGSHGAQLVKTSPNEKWLVKPPPSGLQFLPKLDEAVSKLQSEVGLPGPETHAISTNQGLQTAVKWDDQATKAFPGKTLPSADQLSPDDRLTLQKHQAFDWLIGNHDSHTGNWLRNSDGKLIGIDKGQAFKYFGRDRLDPSFHPNYYAREPVYNKMWRDHMNNIGEPLNDPNEGELGNFIKKIQDIPDDHIRDLFRPYAEGAAGEGVLGVGANNPKNVDPKRKLGPSQFPPNDVEAFLNAVVNRKNNLQNDLGMFHDKISSIREMNKLKEPFDANKFAKDYLDILPNSQSSLGTGKASSDKAKLKLENLIENYPHTHQTHALKLLYKKYFGEQHDFGDQS